METAIDSRKYLEDLGVPPVGMTTKIEKFRLSSHPLGNEIDIWWEYSDDNGNITIPSNYQFYLFKRCEQEVTDEEIYNYILNPSFENLAKGLFVFINVGNLEREVQDFRIETGKTYYYKAILVNRNNHSDYSPIVSASIKSIGFTADINVVDSKNYVIEGLRRIMETIGKFTNARIMVYNDFPMESDYNAAIVVTRANGEVAYKYWADLITDVGSNTITGEIDVDVIQVVWECLNNPGLRDKMTNILRGTKRLLKRYLRSQKGVLDVDIVHTGDGSMERVEGSHIAYGSMLIRLKIENNLIAGKGVETFSDIENLFIQHND